jgi:GWxTD domain-containing protein
MSNTFKIFFSAVIFLHFNVTAAFGLDAAVSVATFSNNGQPYVEVQYNFVGKTLYYTMLSDSLHWQSAVNITALFKQGDKIVQFDKYQLSGPASNKAENYFDLKRYALAQGDYVLDVVISDVHQPESIKKITIPFSVKFEADKISQSDIQLLKFFTKDTSNSPLAKNGYLMQTLPFDFCDKNTERLIVYDEIYNAQKSTNEEMQVTFAIYDEQIGMRALPIFTQFKTIKPSAQNIILQQLDVSKVPSGNYFLTIEIRNKNKDLLSMRKVNFQRSNPFLNLSKIELKPDDIKDEFVQKLNADSLRYGLKAIFCKLQGTETGVINDVIKSNDEKSMRFHLFRFWAGRNPNNPEKAYNDYMRVARAIDRTYRSGFGYGFETDRGYVFMKYGRPDDITAVPTSPDASGYELWSYNDFPITKQTNVKFLFWDADGSGNMRILHSNARGEIQDRNWKTKLYKHSQNQWTGNGFDDTDVRDNVGRNAGRILEDF